MAKAARKAKPLRAAAPAKQRRASDDDFRSYLRELNALSKRDALAEFRKKKLAAADFGVLADALFGRVDEWYSTGVLALDKMLGGGWPAGRISEICGWESTGKSSGLDQTIAQAQRAGSLCALVDSEQARETAYTARLGVAVDRVVLAEADDIEDGFVQVDKILTVQERRRAELERHRSKDRVPPVFIAWDSLGGTPARVEVESAADDAHVAAAARVINLDFRRIIARLAKNRVTLVFSNHFYKQIGGLAGGHLVAYGGKAVRYYPSIRLWISRTGALKLGDRIVGHTVEAKLRKTKVGLWKPPVELGFVEGAGFDNAYSLYEWGRKHGVGPSYPEHRYVAERGRYKYLSVPGQSEEVAFEDGFVGLGRLLSERPELYQVLAAAFMASAD